MHNGNLVFAHSGQTLTSRSQGRATDKWFIYRYGGLRRYRTGSTIWMDDIIRSKSVKAIKKRYPFDLAIMGLR